MADIAVKIVSHTVRLDASQTLPSELTDCIARYQENLTGLATALLDAGLDEISVRKNIEELFSSYRSELTATLLSLKNGIES